MRKAYYNLTVTGLSVAVALVVGGIELVGALVEHLGIRTGVLAAIGRVDLSQVGYVIVAIFVATWLLSAALWRLGRIEERWS